MDNQNPEKIATKICKRCSKLGRMAEKEIWEFPKKGSGLSEWCKKCHCEYSKEHYRKNADTKIKKILAWQQKNKNKLKSFQKKYREKNRKTIPKPKATKPKVKDDQRPKNILDNIVPVSPTLKE